MFACQLSGEGGKHAPFLQSIHVVKSCSFRSSFNEDVWINIDSYTDNMRLDSEVSPMPQRREESFRFVTIHISESVDPF